MPEVIISISNVMTTLGAIRPDLITPLPVGIVRQLFALSNTDSVILKDILFGQLRRSTYHLPEDAGMCVYAYLHKIAGGLVV